MGSKIIANSSVIRAIHPLSKYSEPFLSLTGKAISWFSSFYHKFIRLFVNSSAQKYSLNLNYILDRQNVNKVISPIPKGIGSEASLKLAWAA